MQVFLVRHAEAVVETRTLPDPQRHLTAQGRIQAKELGDRMRWHDCAPSHVWSSPLVRAVQTAELITSCFAPDVTIEVMPELAPGQHERVVVAAVGGLPAGSSVVLVGHEPSLSAIGTLLVGADDFAGLAKAQAARIVDGKLRWRFSWNAEAPELLAR